MLETLKSKGYELTFSAASPSPTWGKWFVGLRKGTGHMVNGYGEDEASAFADALKTVEAFENRPPEVQKGH